MGISDDLLEVLELLRLLVQCQTRFLLTGFDIISRLLSNLSVG